MPLWQLEAGTSLRAEDVRWAALGLSYLAHAVLWTLASAALARFFARSAASKHLLWKVALFAPLLSTALSFGSIPQPEQPARDALLMVVTREHAEQTTPTEAVDAASDGSSQSSFSAARLRWLWFGLLLCPLLGLLRLGGSALLLRGALSGRRRVRDQRLLARFEELAARMGQPTSVLTDSVHVPGPLVVGAREVCVPAALLTHFSDAELDAVFAHELAHVERRDGLWFPLIGLLEAVLWLQPLNRWVCARCRQTAELAADERAVEITGAPRELARALIRLAEVAMPRASLVPSMGSPKPLLWQRVQRLTAPRAGRPSGPALVGRRSGPFASWLCLCALGMLMLELSPRLIAAAPLPLMDQAEAVKALTASVAAARLRAFGAEMERLAHEAWALEVRLEALRAAAEQPDAHALLQLEQDLRHIREIEAWTERRYEAGEAHP